MNRRTLLKATALGGCLTTAAATPSWAQSLDEHIVNAALEEFVHIHPGTSAACIAIERGGQNKKYAVSPDQALFVGSAVKTFILAQYLLDVESKRLSLDTQVGVGPEVWSPGSSVLINLQGKTSAKTILEAMIAHSDNTATDIAINAVGPERVRALIERVPLEHTLIPDSTRRLFSYLSGVDNGQDIGWAGMQKMMAGELAGKPRPAINNTQTMLSTAAEMVHWYQHVLSGKLFDQPATLKEFKRISAMADAIPATLPDDTVGYGKGGSIDWGDFHCFCVAGQMVLPTHKASFCFIVNWTGPDETVASTFTEFVERARKAIALVA